MVIENIRLSRNKISNWNVEPTLEVVEGAFAVATYTPEYPNLTTYGLMCCKAIIFYDPREQKGMVCHMQDTYDIARLIETLTAAFEGNFGEVSAFVVSGSWQNSEEGGFSTIRELTDEIANYQPAHLFVNRGYMNVGYNSNRDVWERSVTLDLGSGEVRQLLSGLTKIM